jgi:hypothetical protein
MVAKVIDGELILSSGRKIDDIFHNVIGLGEEGKGFSFYEGFDNLLNQPREEWMTDDIAENVLANWTDEERHELADYMIKQWLRVKGVDVNLRLVMVVPDDTVRQDIINQSRFVHDNRSIDINQCNTVAHIHMLPKEQWVV